MRRLWVIVLALPLATCGTQAQHEPSPPCVDDEAIRDTVRMVMFKALDTALQKQIEHAFEVWLKDDHDQPARASRGINQAINAYNHARRITMAWAPAVCK